ncbi:MAG: metallophosphoesterase family protein [Parvularculaceae bacterium]
MARLANIFKPKGKAENAPTLPDGLRLYAIGDIHGRDDLLSVLLEKISIDAAGAPYRLVFLGDYVDRGPTSAQVIDRLIGLKTDRPETVFLMGNHEQSMIDFLADPYEMEAWLDWGGMAALESYGMEEPQMINVEAIRDEFSGLIPETHLHFLLGLDLCFTAGDYIFVHAGLRHGIELEDQIEKDMLWIRNEFYNADQSYWAGKCIVHGHTPTQKPKDFGWRINIDTGAVWTGKLTALHLEGTSRRFVTT